MGFCSRPKGRDEDRHPQSEARQEGRQLHPEGRQEGRQLHPEDRWQVSPEFHTAVLNLS